MHMGITGSARKTLKHKSVCEELGKSLSRVKGSCRDSRYNCSKDKHKHRFSYIIYDVVGAVYICNARKKAYVTYSHDISRELFIE